MSLVAEIYKQAHGATDVYDSYGAILLRTFTSYIFDHKLS